MLKPVRPSPSRGVLPQDPGPRGPDGLSEPPTAAGQQDAPDLGVSVSGGVGSVGPAAGGEPAGVCAGVSATAEGDGGHPEGLLQHCADYAEGQSQRRTTDDTTAPVKLLKKWR